MRPAPHHSHASSTTAATIASTVTAPAIHPRGQRRRIRSPWSGSMLLWLLRPPAAILGL